MGCCSGSKREKIGDSDGVSVGARDCNHGKGISEDPRIAVREAYGKIARSGVSCCCGMDSSAEEISMKIGYTSSDLADVPEGSNLGLGCGNPTAHASLMEGETVLDLGSGGGFDCFLAAKRVGKTGRVIGVDMTSDMLEKARRNAREGGYDNVEFRLGEIEHLPVADNSIDVIISNCVINLSPNPRQVFREAYRVLKPGGRMFITDMVLTGELPVHVRESVELYVGCIAGAVLKEEYLQGIRDAGFVQAEILEEIKLPVESVERIGIPADIARNALECVASVKVEARK